MHLSDVRGLTRLATDATAEVTRVVEAVHEAVLGAPCLRGTPVHAPVVAITRLVYRGIYAITRTTGHGVDGVLGALEPLAPEAPSNAARDRVVAALNGVIGDHLARSANPLASRMSAKYHGAPLDVDPRSLRAADPPLGRKLMLLIHGLCMSPAAWARQGEDRAAALAEQLGFTPLHIQYNSGLHVSVNGRALAEWLDALLRAWPVPLEEPQWLDPDAAESRRAADTSRPTRRLTEPRSTPAEEKL